MQTTRAISALEPGQTLDHYRLEALVAESATSRTFRATDLRDGHTVAVKVPHATIDADPVTLERFHREEEIGSVLHHPNVMRIFREGDRTGFYLVMEWCDGRSLAAMLKESGRLAPERAVRIAIAILHALEYLHQHGVVHRDLNPDHIMVDSRDQIKLIDFGLALRQGARRLTFTGYSPVLGTPDYISPEQVRGKRGEARSDLYATGIILWQMLSGRRPFSGNSPLAVMNARLTRNLPPLQLPGFPFAAQLQEVVCRATEREPAHRYGSAHEFARDLEHLDQVGIAHRPELTENTRRLPELSRILLYGALVLLPVLLVLMMVALGHRH